MVVFERLVCVIEFLINLLSSATRRKFKFSKLTLYRGKEYLKAFDCNIKAMQSFTRKVLYVFFIFIYFSLFFISTKLLIDQNTYPIYFIGEEKSQIEFAPTIFREFYSSIRTKKLLSIITNRTFQIIIN